MPELDQTNARLRALLVRAAAALGRVMDGMSSMHAGLTDQDNPLSWDDDDLFADYCAARDLKAEIEEAVK